MNIFFQWNLESILAISWKTESNSEVFLHWFYMTALSKILESFKWDFFAIPLVTKLQAFNLLTSLLKIRCLTKIYSRKYFLVCKTSLIRLQDVVNVAIFGFPRHVEDILEDEKFCDIGNPFPNYNNNNNNNNNKNLQDVFSVDALGIGFGSIFLLNWLIRIY